MKGNFKAYVGKRAFTTFKEDMKRLMFAYVSDQNMVSTMQNVNKEFQKITKDSIQVKRYLVVGNKEHQELELFTRNEKITTAHVIFKGNFADNSGFPWWGVYLQGRTFIDTSGRMFEYDNERSTFVRLWCIINNYPRGAGKYHVRVTKKPLNGI